MALDLTQYIYTAPHSERAYLAQLKKLLPPGPIWEFTLATSALLADILTDPALQEADLEGEESRWMRLLSCFAAELRRVEEMAADVINQAVPGLSTDLLPQWEETLGLPEACALPADYDTIAKRQETAHLKFYGEYEATTKQYLINIAAGLGFTITVDELQLSTNSFIFGVAVMGQNEFGGQGSFAVLQIFIEPWYTGNIDQLRCKLGSIKPAHTILDYIFMIGADFTVSASSILEDTPTILTWTGAGSPTSYEWYTKESELSEWVLFSVEQNPTILLGVGSWDIKLIASDENSTSTKEYLAAVTVVSTVIQEFIMSGTTKSSGTPQITLGYLEPQTGETEFTINWGDGTSNAYASAVTDFSINHVYPSNSIDYTISISQAQMTSYWFCDWTNTDNLWIDSVDAWGIGFVKETLQQCFYNSIITTIPDSWEGLENVVIMSYCFYNSNLTTIPDSWEGLDSVSLMSYCFYNSNLTIIPIIDLNSLSNVTNCKHMFEQATAVTSDILPVYNQLVTTASDFVSCFGGLTNATNYSLIPSSWK